MGPGSWDPGILTPQPSPSTDRQSLFSLGQRAGGLRPCPGWACRAGVCVHDAWPSPKTCLLAAAELASSSLALLKPSVCPDNSEQGVEGGASGQTFNSTCKGAFSKFSPPLSPGPQQAARPGTHHPEERLAERGLSANTVGTQWPGAQSLTRTLIIHSFIHLPSAFGAHTQCLRQKGHHGH